jgi:hypothetical protein
MVVEAQLVVIEVIRLGNRYRTTTNVNRNGTLGGIGKEGVGCSCCWM